MGLLPGRLDGLESEPALPPVGLGSVPVGARMALAGCGLIAVGMAPGVAALSVHLLLILSFSTAVGRFGALLRSWRVVAWVCLSLLAVYSVAWPSGVRAWVFGLDGLTSGATIALRLVCFFSILSLLLHLTGPLALVRWAGEKNADLGVILSMTLSVIPAMRDQLDATLAAQQARGLRLEGSIPHRLRIYLALLIPVVVTSLVRGYAMAALLKVRGHGSARRTRHPVPRTAAGLAVWVTGPLWVAGTALATGLVG